MSTKQHYDAAERPCYSREQLCEIIDHKPSRELLGRFLLCHLWILPGIEIRVPKAAPDAVEVILFGIGRNSSFTKDLSQKSLSALRRLWKDAWKRGWSTHEGCGYVSFRRSPRVMRDPTRRYF